MSVLVCPNRNTGTSGIGFPVTKAAAASIVTAFMALASFVCPARVVAKDGAAELAFDPILRVETGRHTALITSVDCRGDFVVTGSMDKTARVWRRDAEGKLSPQKVLRPPLPESENEHDGQIYAVALSPDGKTVACGGYTQSGTSSRFCAYLFDRASGIMLHVIPDLPGVVTALAFAPDGTLAVGTGGDDGGIRRFTVPDGDPIARPDDCKDACRSLSYASDGRLVAAFEHSMLRLYGRGGLDDDRQIVRTEKGAEPNTIRFSPDGTKIAVAYRYSLRIEIRNAARFNEANILPEPKQPTVAPDQDLNCVGWAADGSLVGAGTLRTGPNNAQRAICRLWRAVGQNSGAFEAPLDTPVADDIVTGLAPAPDGATLFATGEPSIGSISPDGTPQTDVTCPIARQGGENGGIQLSADGSTLYFSYKPFGQEPAFFVIPDMHLAPVDEFTHGLPPPDDPRLPHKSLRLDLGEEELVRATAGKSVLVGTNFSVRCYDAGGKQTWQFAAPAECRGIAAASGGSVFVVAYADGTVRWYRLKDLKEGDTPPNILNFFPSANKNQWILWTHAGYYASSVDGEDLIGWHVNRAPDQAADFFTASQYRKVFSRSDVVKLMLRTLDEEKALAVADHLVEHKRHDLALDFTPHPADPAAIDIAASFNKFPDMIETPTRLTPVGNGNPAVITNSGAEVISRSEPGVVVHTPDASKLEDANSVTPGPGRLLPAVSLPGTPPIVRIVSPEDQATITGSSVTLQIAIRTPKDAPVQKVSVLVDGGPAVTTRSMDWTEVASAPPLGGAQIAPDEVVRTIKVKLPDHSCRVSVSAQSANGYSTSVHVDLRRIDTAPSSTPKGNLYILAIGVGKFTDPKIPKLKYPATDAKAFCEVMKKQERLQYNQVIYHFLPDEEAKGTQIVNELGWIKHAAQNPADVTIIFFSGHGTNIGTEGYFFLANDFDSNTKTNNNYESTGIPGYVIGQALQQITNGRVLLFLDTCDSGNVDLTALVGLLKAGNNGVGVYCASEKSQSAEESGAWGHGAFTKAILEAMSGVVDPNVALGPRAKLRMHVLRESKEITLPDLQSYLKARVQELTDSQQTPTFASPSLVADAPIAMVPDDAP